MLSHDGVVTLVNILNTCYWDERYSLSIPIQFAIVSILAFLVWIWHMVYRPDSLDKIMPAIIVVLVMWFLGIIAIVAVFYIFAFIASH